MLDDPRQLDVLLHSCEIDQPEVTNFCLPMPVMDYLLLTCSRMVLKNRSLKLWSWNQGKQSSSLEDDHAKRGFPIQLQGTLDSA